MGGEERPLPASHKKLSEARNKGNIARSQEINMVLGLLFSFLCLKYLAPHLLNTITNFMVYIFRGMEKPVFAMPDVTKLFQEFWLSFFIIFLPFSLLTIVLNLLVSYVQVGPLFTFNPLKPSLDKINPISGFQRLFSMEKVVELIKSVIKIIIVAIIARSFFAENIPLIFTMKISNPESYLADLGGLVYKLSIDVIKALLILAIADFAYRKYKHKKDLMMSHQEVKEENKQAQGNPHIKGLVRKKRMELRKKLSLKQVPKATVVITNPDHFAVAIKYDPAMDVPLVVAKGADYLAQKIKEIARKHSVPLVENKPLARTLYRDVDINKPIPPELYLAVAKIIVHVSQIRRSLFK